MRRLAEYAKDISTDMPVSETRNKMCTQNIGVFQAHCFREPDASMEVFPLYPSAISESRNRHASYVREKRLDSGYWNTVFREQPSFL